MTALLLRFLPHAIIIAIAGTGGALTSRVYYLGQIKSEQAARANEHAAAAISLATEQAKNREIEQKWQARADEQRKVLEDAKRENLKLAASIAAGPAVNVDGLRRQLAAARGAAATSSLAAAAACDARAGAYEALLADGSRLLDEGRRMAGEIARSHDDRAAEVVGLVTAWPR